MVKWFAPALAGDRTSAGAKEILRAVQPLNLTHYPDMEHSTPVSGPVQSRISHLKG